MKTMTITLKNELVKILWRPKYRAMIAIYAAIGLGAGLLGSSGFYVRLIGEFRFFVAGSSIVYGALSLYRSILLPLAIFMLSADMLTHEMETKSIRCILTRPVGRLDAYLAKCLAMLCYVAISLGVGLLVYMAWQVISAAVGGAAGQQPIDAAGQQPIGAAVDNPLLRTSRPATFLSQASAAAEASAAYILTLLPMAAFIAFAAFVAVGFRSPALVMFLCIASCLALYAVGIMHNGVGAALFTAYTSWYRMWLGSRLPWRSLVTASGLLTSTCVAFFCFGYFIFDKKDM